jgi:type VI secretion system protein VasG
MTEISRVALFGKLNSLCYKGLASATDFCKLRGNPYVELVHWLTQLLQAQDSDLQRLIRHFEIDSGVLAKDVIAALDRLPRGSTAISDLSEHVQAAVERGWVYGSLMFAEAQVRSGHLIVGMLKTPSLHYVLLGISRQFDRIQADTLTKEFARILADSPEQAMRASDGSMLSSASEDGGAVAPALLGKQEALKRFAVDLTERARKGEIDPVTGRD